ncbi:MAG: glutamate racemase [Salinivirgaceae bacterium]|nr:glutamate racemase [Salinivirgaceae bacterium]
MDIVFSDNSVMNSNPIGIFDSGLGGLTVWREVRRLMPGEDIVYFADSLHCPYGHKPVDKIIDLTSGITDFLLGKFGCKLIIVACNTATAAAIDTLRSEYDVPFVGMEPAIKQAALHTKTGVVGVLATKGTFDGRLYKATSEKYAQGIEVLVQVGDGLVELVESNKINSPEADSLLKKYVRPMVDSGADQIVLGCTHYPFYKTQIEAIAGAEVAVIDPAPAVAKRAHELLEAGGLLAGNGRGTDLFVSSAETGQMRSLLESTSALSLADTIVEWNTNKYKALQ